MRFRFGQWIFSALITGSSFSQNLMIPMDLTQTDHLKAYGVAYWALSRGVNVEWLLNYRCGSFSMAYSDALARMCRKRGVAFEIIQGSEEAAIHGEIENANMEAILLEKDPKIAVYTPPNQKPWDDAVTLALTYAEIPYETFWDEGVLTGKLGKCDWLHLHHEDFTGQYGKFYANYRNAPWYIEQQNLLENEARRLGFRKVSQLKLAVVKAIHDFVSQGGFLFAMCSATDSYDIALAAAGTDICETVFDGDPVDPAFQEKLNDGLCYAFENFEIYPDPLLYEFSNIDTTPREQGISRNGSDDYFTLFEFSAKYDPVPTMLTQSHANVVHNFMGQTTGFQKSLIKTSVVIMTEKADGSEVKYIHGNIGRGTFTFLGGHDPEDYQHFVGDPPTQLSLHKNSPGYRLILNNILFPAARKKHQKT